jgi:hypothetical protein
MRKTPVVLGVLSIVFASLVVLWSGAQLAMQGMTSNILSDIKTPARAGQPDLSVVMKRAAEVQKEMMPITATIQGGMVALSVVLFVVGLGLLKRQVWSRRAAIAWGAVALLFLPVRIYLECGVVLPRAQAVAQEAMAQIGTADASHLVSSLQSAQSAATAGLLVLLYAPFPIVLLVLMGRSSARNDLLS